MTKSKALNNHGLKNECVGCGHSPIRTSKTGLCSACSRPYSNPAREGELAARKES